MSESLDTSEGEALPWVKPSQPAPGDEDTPAMTKEERALGAFLAAMYDSNLDGAAIRKAMLNALGLSQPPAPEHASGERRAPHAAVPMVPSPSTVIQWPPATNTAEPAVEPAHNGIEFLMHGRNMAFKIGNQMFTLAHEPDEPGDFEFMKSMLLHALSTFTPDVKTAVDRFLGWKLPQDFAPDCGISFTPMGHPNGWPIGTNLLTADQARQMFEHALSASPAAPEAAKALHVQAVKLTDAQREALTVKNDVYIPGAVAQPEQQAQAGEPEVVAGSNAFGCDKEAAGGTLCADWCGSSKCPTPDTTPKMDSSTGAYKAYAENLPGANDHLTEGARKRLEEAAKFCLNPRPNFEPKRNRCSDDGYYEHDEASRLWWAFAAGMNYEEKRNREAMAELESSYRMWWRIAKNLGEDCTKRDAALKACVEAAKEHQAAIIAPYPTFEQGHATQQAWQARKDSAFEGLTAAITQAQEALK